MAATQEIAWRRLAAEATVIVSSILLTFAIDAWWEDRNKVELEQRLLTAVLAEFEQIERGGDER